MKLELIRKRTEAKGTETYFWKTEKEVAWVPGQYFYYTLPKLKYADTRGDTRQFTVASSPTEGGSLQLTTRYPDNPSGFKKTMLELPVGSIIEGDGPSGILTFNKDSEKDKTHVFLAGGIGITPFRSMIKFNIDKKLGIKMHLIYSNSAPDEIAFLKELQFWAEKYDFFKLDLTVSQSTDKKWKGLKGRIDSEMVKKLTGKYDPEKTAYWAVGPSAFVYAMEGIIDKIRILPENVHIEIFTGY